MKTLANNSFINALRKPMALFMVLCLLNGQFLWAIDSTDITGVTINGAGTVTQGANTAGGIDTNFDIKGTSIYNLKSGGTGVNDAWNVSGGASMLARVQQAVHFNGNLNAAGIRVYVVSPNGVHIGETATISASKFVASGLNISDTDFAIWKDDVFAPFDIGDGITQIGQVQNDGMINVTGDAYLLGSKVLNTGTIVSDGGLVLLATTTGDGVIMVGSGVDKNIQVVTPIGDAINIAGLGDGDVVNDGSISSTAGQIVLAAGDTFAQALDNLDPAMVLADETLVKLNEVAARQPDVTIESEGNGNLRQDGAITTGTDTGLITLHGAESATIETGSSTESGEIVVSGGDLSIEAPLSSGGDLTLMATEDDMVADAGATLDAGADLTVASKKLIYTHEPIDNPGDVILDASNKISLVGDLKSQGSILLSTDENYNSSTVSPNGSLTVAVGDIEAEGDINLETSLVLSGADDQAIVSNDGTVTSEGLIYKATEGTLFIISGDSDVAVNLKDKVNANGNIDILGEGDVLLGDDISAIGSRGRGGVLVISTEGEITTPGADGLNIMIRGYSDTATGEGIQINKDFDNVAAIVLISKDTLTLDTNAFLYADGTYGDTGIDDRQPSDKLDTPDTVIGDAVRDEGDGVDIAIYLASIDGDVVVAGIVPYTIVVNNRSEGDGAPTVVMDARDSVRFPMMEGMSEAELLSMIQEYDGEGGGYRLEVISRITEWLSEAIAFNRLPFADNPEIMEELLGEEYVLRGAGQDNDAIANTGETRAWVLADPQDEVIPVVPLASLEIPELKGCPVEMDAAASELAMNSDSLQLLIGTSLAANPNLQPCKACQKLVTAAAILNDADGIRMAAMNEIFNTLAPIDAPFTPEVSASIATAFANLSNDDPQYALANEYINAFVDYVAVVGEELQAPVGDPVAFTLQKHGESITSSDNPNMAAYVMAQVQTAGGAI
ncbi:MAG: hypothetical protein ACYSUT_02215 [Planctomycetota bacterium]|jgi:filamentous hemagglutinin family protein